MLGLGWSLDTRSGGLMFPCHGTGYLFGLTDDACLVGDAGPIRLEFSAITDVHGNRIARAAAESAVEITPPLRADDKLRVDQAWGR